MFMAEVAAQKAPDGYETMDVDFVSASESPMVQADQRFNKAILKEGREAEAQLDAERAHAAAIEAFLQAEPDVVDVNRAAEARLDAERADAALIYALLQAEQDNHGADTHVGSYGWFAPAAKDDKAVSFCKQ